MDNIATLKGLKCPHCGSEQLTVTGTKGALGAAIVTGAAFGAIGNLVAGSNAAANQVTEPLRYKCAGCGQKFEALPLMAPTLDVLAAPCTVTFTRESSFVGAAVPQIVYINGIKLGAVKNGKSITFTTSNRYNVMFVTDQYGLTFKGEYRFEAQPGGNVSVRFNRRFLDAQSVPAAISPATTGTPTAVYSRPPMAPNAVSTGQTQVRFCTNCGGSLAAGNMFCPTCGEKRFSPQEAFAGADNNRQKPCAVTESALSVNLPKAVWTFGILAIAWIALILLQGLFHGRLVFSADMTFFIVAALLGTGIYLLVQNETKYKLYGAATGLIASFLSAGTSLAVILNNRLVGAFSLADALGFGEPYYWSLFGRALLFSVLTLGAAMLAWYLLHQKPKEQRMFGTGGVAAGVYALCSLISWLLQYRYDLSRFNAAGLFSIFAGILSDALVLFLAVRFTNSLCRAQCRRVQLFGLGKAWAWIAAIGMFLSIGIVLGTAFDGFKGIAYTASLLLAIAGTAGYILLLCKCRSGLYVIVAAAALVLGGQFFGSLLGLIYGSPRYVASLFGSIVGAANPLLAWLAVRSADRRGYMPAAQTWPVASVQQYVSGFQKFASIFNIVIGGLLLIVALINLSFDLPEIDFIITFTLLAAVYLGFGIWFTASQCSTAKLYPKWMKVINIILFSIGALLLAVSLIGIAATL